MARQYRQMIEHHKENLGGAGDFNSFLEITKDADKKGGWVDKIVIHYVVEDRGLQSSEDSSNLFSGLGYGLFFAVSRSGSLETVDSESGLLDPNDLVNIRARDGMAGSVTIPVKHLIRENTGDTGEMDGKLWCWVKTPDVTDNDDMIVRFYVEVWGRWVSANGI